METDSRKVRMKYRVAISSVVAAVFLTSLKLVVGLQTNSLGILSEAAHSALDLGAALMTLMAVRISDKPADESHNYGHSKIESLSAFIEVLLLLATCGYILYEAVERMLGRAVAVDVNVYAFAVMGISILVDISRSRALYRVAREHKNQALEADALHFSSDIFSSLVVILGLVGYRFLNFPLADAVAAMIVSILVIIVSIRLARRAVDVLLDKAPEGFRQKLDAVLNAMPAVERIHDLRLRTAGAKTFVDVKLALQSGLSFLDAHAIAEQVEKKVAELIPDADVIVHADPDTTAHTLDDVKNQLVQLIRRHANLFQGYHHLKIFRHLDRYVISFHLVMSGNSPLEEVHKLCDHLERDIKQKLPGAEVTIHVEPFKPKTGNT